MQILRTLNRICEHDLTKDKRDCPWLSNIHVLNERLLAFDARHRDVVGATEHAIGKAPTINDIVQNMLDKYDNAYKYWSNRKHRNWGLFRSMWPASVFLDRRLDRRDRETRAWLTVFAILVAGCSLVSVGSMWQDGFKHRNYRKAETYSRVGDKLETKRFISPRTLSSRLWSPTPPHKTKNK